MIIVCFAVALFRVIGKQGSVPNIRGDKKDRTFQNYINFREDAQCTGQNGSKGKRAFSSPDIPAESRQKYMAREKKTEHFSTAALSPVRLFNLLQRNFKAN